MSSEKLNLLLLTSLAMSRTFEVLFYSQIIRQYFFIKRFSAKTFYCIRQSWQTITSVAYSMFNWHEWSFSYYIQKIISGEMFRCIRWWISLNYPKMAKIHITYSDEKSKSGIFFYFTVLTDHFRKNEILITKSLAESFGGQFYFKNHWNHSEIQLPKIHTILYRFPTDYRRRWFNGLLYDFSSIRLT